MGKLTRAVVEIVMATAVVYAGWVVGQMVMAKTRTVLVVWSEVDRQWDKTIADASASKADR